MLGQGRRDGVSLQVALGLLGTPGSLAHPPGLGLVTRHWTSECLVRNMDSGAPDGKPFTFVASVFPSVEWG